MAAPSYEIYPNGGSGVISGTVHGGNISEGAVLELSCTPDEGYYFIGWNVTEGAQVENQASPSGASIILPDSHIDITANMGRLEAPVISAEPVYAEYTGQPAAIEPLIEGGNGLTAQDLTILYTRLPDGMPIAEAPTEVGEYQVTISYEGSAQNTAAYAETTLTIGKANLTAKPADVISAEADRVTFFTEYGQRYLVLPYDGEFPTKASSGWMDGFGDNHTWENLQLCTKYAIYTHSIETDIQHESEIMHTVFYTDQYFSCELNADNADMEEISFTLAENDNAVPEPLVLTMTNTGKGPLKNIKLNIEGDEDKFFVDTGDMKKVLQSGESNVVKVLPMMGAPFGSYEANIAISAVGVEGGYTTPTFTESVDISYIVYEDNQIKSLDEMENSWDVAPWETAQPEEHEQDEQQAQAPTPAPVMQMAQNILTGALTKETAAQETKPLQQSTQAQPPVIQPIVLPDAKAPEESIPQATNTTLVNWQDSGNLIASLNSISYTYSDAADEEYTEPDIASNAAALGAMISAGNDHTGDGDDGQAEAEQGPLHGGHTMIEEDKVPGNAPAGQQAETGRKPFIKSVSSIVWFYGLILLAAVIFTLSLFYVDSRLRRRRREAAAHRKQAAKRPQTRQQKEGMVQPHIIIAEAAE